MPDSSTSTRSDRVPVYFDCDTGIDDALALAYLLGRPDVDLVGIGSVSGNIDAERGARNTLDLLALAGRDDVPVAVGAHDPLTGSFAGGAPHVHGSNGIGDIDLPAAGRGPVDGSAADLLIRLAHEHAGRLQVIAVGPLTNLALALRTEPRLVDLVPRVTIMGGAALVPGNVTPVAEANIANDPEAAAAVVEASWPVTLVPLDVTLEHVLDEDDRSALLASGHPLPRALGEMLDLYYGFYVELYGERCSALHDPLAAALALDGVAATVAPAVPVTVDATDGPGRGQTICDLRNQRQRWVDRDGAHVRVVLEAEPPLGPHLMQTILGAFGS